MTLEFAEVNNRDLAFTLAILGAALLAGFANARG
jgi:hypothetical protein